MKKIIPVTSVVVNYLTYIQAYCGVNWELDDNQRTPQFMSHEDMIYIQSCAKHLSFGDGGGTSLSGAFYFLPAYIFFEKSDGLLDYFNSLIDCYRMQNTASIFRKYRLEIQQLREFYPLFMSDFECLVQDDVLLAMRNISTIYMSYYKRYINQIWTMDMVAIQQTTNYIQAIFRENNVVEKWEQMTGYELLSDNYHVIIVPSLQFGPRANSLHYGVNIFPSLTEYCKEDYFDHFISHEVGTHILKPHTLDKLILMEDDIRVPYIAFENLAKHMNLKLLPPTIEYKLGEDYYEDTVFESIYDNLYAQYKSDIAVMYVKAIEAYKQRVIQP